MKKEIGIDIISYLFVLLFAYTGINKLLELQTFKGALAVSPISVVRVFGPLISYIIPPFEILVAVSLTTVKFRYLGLYSSAILMFAFLLYVSYINTFIPHTKLPCTCGGIISTLTWKGHLYLNLLLTSLAVFGLRLFRHPTTYNQDKNLTNVNINQRTY